MIGSIEMAERIRERRHDLGLTQTELARRAETSTPTIARIEGGEAFSVAFGTMIRVLNALSYDVYIESGITVFPTRSESSDIDSYLNDRYFGGER